jgi:hypothetical protein
MKGNPGMGLVTAVVLAGGSSRHAGLEPHALCRSRELTEPCSQSEPRTTRRLLL